MGKYQMIAASGTETKASKLTTPRLMRETFCCFLAIL